MQVAAECTKVGPAEVVGEDEDDVGFLWRGGVAESGEATEETGDRRKEAEGGKSNHERRNGRQGAMRAAREGGVDGLLRRWASRNDKRWGRGREFEGRVGDPAVL